LPKGKPVNKGGRPTKKTPQTITDAIKYLKIGLSEATACDLIGIDISTWTRWKQKDLGFAQDIKRAKSDAIVKATTKLVEAINKDKLGAIIFFLKSRSDEFRPSYISAEPAETSRFDSTELIKAMDCITQLSRNTSKVSRASAKK